MILTRNKLNYLKELDKSLSDFGLFIIVVGSDSEYTPDMLQYDSFVYDNNKYKCIRFILIRSRSVFKEYFSFAHIRHDFRTIYNLTHLSINKFPAYE